MSDNSQSLFDQRFQLTEGQLHLRQLAPVTDKMEKNNVRNFKISILNKGHCDKTVIFLK